MLDYLTIAGVIVGGFIYTIVGYIRAQDGISFDWRYLINQLIPIILTVILQLTQIAMTTAIEGGFVGGFLFGLAGKWATDSVISWKRLDEK